MGTEKQISGRKRVVPWFSMNEWVTVYQLLYSDDTEQQKNGLDRMISWKARCSNLPLGVECSLGIAQVLCEDPDHASQTSLSITREQQLRLVYSTAVMRFLNLMLEIKKDEDISGTMYHKAANLNIPEWIVNLRHDAAHGVSLPDLSLLRTAAVFIFKWLDEHYWEKEMQLVTDWHVTEAEVLALSAKERELQDIMETWEALSLYSLAGFHQLRLIPDNELMERIASIHQMLSDDHTGESEMGPEINQAMVSAALKLVLRRVVCFFKNSSLGKAAFMANSLIKGDFLLPSVSLMKILYPSGYDSQSILHKLPQALSSACEDLLFHLWNLGAVPDLVSKLISVSCDTKESDLQRNMAALWTQKILLSCLKVREARKVFSAAQDRLDHKHVVSHYKETFPDATKSSILYSLAFKAVDSQRSDLREGYTWNSLMPIPSSLTSLDLVKQCFIEPSKFSSIFLPSLMELTSPSIPLKSRTLLLNLLGAFSNEELDSEKNFNGQSFSVKDLSNEYTTEVAETQLNPVGTNAQPLKKSHWTLSQDYLEWHKCPLGAVPWQREQAHQDENEFHGRQQQRIWPKLLMPGDWVMVPSPELPNSTSNGTGNLNRIKDGRVKKRYAKQTPSKILTPVKAFKMQRRSASPRQKAIEVLASL